MKVDRLVSIIMILLEKERIGAKELADMFEVSQRTIYRDIDAIDRAGIPIRATSGVGGGFEIMPNFKIDKKVFSNGDLTSILMALSGLSNVMNGNELVNTLAKIKSFIPAKQAKEIEMKANQLNIDLSPWMGNENIPFNIEVIQEALERNCLLKFRYTDHSGSTCERTAEPYQLVLKGNQWYLQSFCHLRNAFRLFKLCRMQQLSLLEETFIPKEFPKPQLDIRNMQESIQTEITLRIHKSIMDRVLDFCSYDKFTPDGEEHYIVKFPFIERDYYFDMLLGFGDKCECLSPLTVREEIKSRVRKMDMLYH